MIEIVVERLQAGSSIPPYRQQSFGKINIALTVITVEIVREWLS